ncbi:uncharacterized protein LOC135393522 [Ornithodoros turicata]|uniref:uncharacterized protein LOC135393522 n=1 Tax=Ornithodoros turicata TaxID=34597 RepID=UPI003138C806
MDRSGGETWVMAMVAVEDVYHTIWTCVCAREIVLDSFFHRYKQRCPWCIIFFLFHLYFLRKGSSWAPHKMAYLLDMLFHLVCVLWQGLLLTAYFRCATLGMCRTSLVIVVASIAYHTSALCAYYRWLSVTPKEGQPPCLFALCGEQVRLWWCRVPPPSSSVHMEQEMLGHDRHSASMGFSQHALATVEVASQESMSTDVL